MDYEFIRNFAGKQCGSSSVGRALASQAKGREFESRLPLFKVQEYHPALFVNSVWEYPKRITGNTIITVRYIGSVDFQVGQKATGKLLVIVFFLAGCLSRERFRFVDARHPIEQAYVFV